MLPACCACDILEAEVMLMRHFFMETERLGFSEWEKTDIESARTLWSDPLVGKYICAAGAFSEAEINARLKKELRIQKKYGASYWPIFRLSDSAFIGCCGLHPLDAGEWELGAHLLPAYWRQGYAPEALSRAISYAFENLNASVILAGHHPDHPASPKLLERLGFKRTGTVLYPPTGLMHPTYRLDRPAAR